MTKSCPSCGASASGKFCSQCGSSLQIENICDCGNRIPPDGRFCNMCGRPAGERGAIAPLVAGKSPPAVRSGSEAGSGTGGTPARPDPTTDAPKRATLIIAGVSIAAALILAVVLIPRMGADPAPPVANAPAPSGGLTGDPRDIDLTSMTPEDAAIRLFERVLILAESGDSAQARTFVPMAISAYGLVPELTLDHRYDMAMIHFVNDDPAAAAAQADTILTAAPTHLFGLAAAAEAAARMGDTATARVHYQRFLDNYDSEVANNAAEYEMHAPLPPAIRMAAIAFLNATE